jgi:hypothetical protein
MSRRPASFTEADARRACRAAPDRTVEIHLPDGTVIRILPGGARDTVEIVKKKEVRL